MRSIIAFIKYNNTVPIVLAAIILGTGAVFAASPDFREAVLSSASPVPQAAAPAKPIDLSRLLALDLATYDIAVRIDQLSETADTYLVDYSYDTYDVVSGAWRETRKARHMDIPKAVLGKRSLTDYLSEQLGQVTHREIAYLDEVRTAAADGAGIKKNAAKYAALVGQEIKTGDGTPSSVGAGTKDGKSTSKSSESDSKAGGVKATSSAAAVISDAKLREMIVAAVADFLAIDTSMPTPVVVEPVTVHAPAPAGTDETPVTDPASASDKVDASADDIPAPETDSTGDQDTVIP